jgi:hypothetical protein
MQLTNIQRSAFGGCRSPTLITSTAADAAHFSSLQFCLNHLENSRSGLRENTAKSLLRMAYSHLC